LAAAPPGSRHRGGRAARCEHAPFRLTRRARPPVGAGTGDFQTLKQHLQTTDGNLSVHLRKLEEAGYVAVDKTFHDRKPRTEVRLTDAGRAAFVRYLDSLSGLLGT